MSSQFWKIESKTGSQLRTAVVIQNRSVVSVLHRGQGRKFLFRLSLQTFQFRLSGVAVEVFLPFEFADGMGSKWDQI